MAKEMFAHPFCFPELKESLERTRVLELEEDVWLIEGNLGLSFFLAPPSSNIYILRDKDMVLVLDTGMHPYYRTKMLDILERYRQDGAKTLVLMVTQGHWDHAMNNPVILESGYENIRFLLPEPEVPVIESIHHWLSDLRKIEKFWNPYESWVELLTQFEEYARGTDEYGKPEYSDVWEAIEDLRKESPPTSFRSALKLLGDRILFRNFRSLGEVAEILYLNGRERRMFGDVEFNGWQVGRFFIIHDESHSPGHICLYDPLHKLILTGDVTIEINPAFFDTSMNNLIAAAGKLKRMAENGHIEILADAHRNPIAFSEVTALTGLEVLNPLQLDDVIRGSDNCASFLRTFEDYYLNLREETLAAHARLGEATIEEIVSELRKSDNPYVKFKLTFPFPSRPELLVARVLDENGYSRRVEDGRILFKPSEKWKF